MNLRPTTSSTRTLPLLALAGALLGCAHDAGHESPSTFDATLAPGAGDAALDAASVVVEAALEGGLDAGSADAPPARADSSSPSDAEADAEGDSPAPARTRIALVVPSLWVALDAGADPFDDRPTAAQCPPTATMAEMLSGEGAYSVNTGECNYVTVMQPTRREAPAGDILKVRLWHFELSAPEPAEAHAAVLVDGLRVLDERIPIPQPGGLITRQLKLERALPLGAPVHFHLHNHGANSWSLVEVSTGP